MKVIGINGSPHPDGNTYLVIKSFFEALENEGMGTEILQVGSGDVKGCVSCMGCAETGRCIVPDEKFEDGRGKYMRLTGFFWPLPFISAPCREP